MAMHKDFLESLLVILAPPTCCHGPMADCSIMVNGTNKTVEHFSFNPDLAKNGKALKCDGGLFSESIERFQ